MYGPDVTFLGVERCDLAQPATLEGADVVIIGAPTTQGRLIEPARASDRR